MNPLFCLKIVTHLIFCTEKNNTTVKIISKRVFSKTSEENEKNLAVNIVKRINRKILPEKYFVKAVKKYEEENFPF